MSALKYILRRFWPVEFWLRPLAVQERIQADEWKEFWSALVGSTLTGTLLGVLLWLTGSIAFDNIWVIVFAGVFAGAGAGIFAVADVFSGAGTFAFASAFAFAGTVVVAFAGAFTLFAFGSSDWAAGLMFLILLANGTILTISFVYDKLNKIRPISSLPGWLYAATFFIGCSLFVLEKFNEIKIQEIDVWGLTLSIAVTIGILAGITYGVHSKPLTNAVNVSKKQLFLFVIFCWIPAMAAWFNPLGSEVLQKKMHILAAYLFITPFFSSGFLTYPLLLPLAAWLYQSDRIQNHTDSAGTPLISFWQSLALPLPRLQQYLALVVEKNIELGYATLRTVQTQSFQGMAARKAAQLVLNGKEGLAFAGYLAVHTNPATLNQLLVGPDPARSVAVLPAVAKNEVEGNDVLLSVYDSTKTGKKGIVQRFLKNETAPYDREVMLSFSQEPLDERLAAADYFLTDNSPECEGKEEYGALLKALGNLTAPKDFQQLSQCQPYELIPEDASWLDGGRQIVSRLEKHRKGILQAYQSLNTVEAKKTYLRNQQERLKAIDWSDLPWFWAGIAKELVEIWDAVYEQEIKETREWLLLEITQETDALRPGNATLNLHIDNKSGAMAQQISLHVEEQESISWVTTDLNLPGLLQGHGSGALRLDLFIDRPGRYIINGILTAIDLDERSYEWPVNFVLHVDEKGKPYQLAEKQYYIVGPRLSNNLLFVGREQLLRDIRLLWQEPANKEALLLIGLRRMGKSSLLEKIHRDGINEKIIPILIDLQGKADQPAFLQAVTEAMTTELQCAPPALEQSNPGPAFEHFLRSLLPALAGRYFLLMIDEANFFARRDYADLPDLLRSLMQAPDVPLLLLFCGTHELRQGARDYDSILYNTTRTKNISYFNANESAEVLTRPVQGFLEYDPQALQLAFQLTHGHPLLLQALGDQLIQTFNEIVQAGKERSNYVTYGDMEQAGQQLSKKENPAFANYWEDADIVQQKLLVVMAATLDETSRKRGSLEYLLAQAAELRIPMERKETFNALDQLTQEEQLIYADSGYSFMVALYRRWILWHYPPERFRESL